MMTCEEFEARLHDLLDERQQPEDDARLCGHASTCDRCFQVLQSQERLFYGLAQLATPEAPNGFSRRVVDEFRPRPSHAALRGMMGLAAVAVAAAVLIALMPWFGGTQTEGESLVRTEETEPDMPVAVQETDDLGGPLWIDNVAPSVPSAPPVAPTVADSNELYRRWLADMAEQMQRISADTPSPVGELTSSLRPVADSISAAIGAVRQTLPGMRSTDEPSAGEKPQAGWQTRPASPLSAGIFAHTGIVV